MSDENPEVGEPLTVEQKDENSSSAATAQVSPRTAQAPIEGGIGEKPGKRKGGGLLSLAIRDKNALYASFMPFVKGTGLFIPTMKPYKLGEEIFILLTLMEETEKIPVAGKVVWITPKGAQGGRVGGVGIQLGDDENAKNARKKIETYLAGALKSDRNNHTM